jgi:hypothetical protein
MARASQKMAFGGMARHHVVEQPYYLKTVPHNPYIGAVHDGVTTQYNEGYAAKLIPFLYRFRHNMFAGLQTGFFSRNPSGKHIHWLEVSTIEKMRVRAFTDEAFPPLFVSAVVLLFTFYHCWRYAYAHPDITLYNLGIWTSKPWIQQMRFSQLHPMDKPIFRYVTRSSEFFGIEDPYRQIARLQLDANDPYLEAVRKAGMESEVTGSRVLKGQALSGPNVVEAATALVARPKQGTRMQI